MDGGYINAGMCKEKNAGVWAHHEVSDPNVSLLTRAKKNGTKAQAPLPPNKLPKLNGKGIKRIQQIIGSILYYAQAVYMTMLKALSSIAVEQTNATEKQWQDAHKYWITSCTTRMQKFALLHKT
jgi:hypothetical protein